MHPAVSGGSVEVVQLLHEQGAVLNPPDNKLFNSVHTAALKKLPVLRYLLENGAAADVNAVNYSKVTAIALASYNNSPPMVELLLQHGADPTIPSDEGNCALSTAIRCGYPDVVRVLLDSGMSATVDLHCGIAPLLLACVEQRTNVVRMLVEEKRVDIMETEREGETVLHRAATLKGSEATVVLQLLLELGADVNGRTVIGDTPLFAASAAHYRTQR
jgi:uncharacterized protein